MKKRGSSRQPLTRNWKRWGSVWLFLILIGSMLLPQAALAQEAAGESEKKTVYLTFDDGPSKNTPDVLNILAKENIQATFFVLGNEAESHPDLIKRIVNEGHQLGNHTYNHQYKSLYTDFREFWRQIVKTQLILEQIVGQRPALLRAPGGTYGNFDANYFTYLAEAGFAVYDWDVDSGDSKRRNVPASEIIQEVKKSSLKKNLVVLLHDGSGHGESVKALPSIIKYYKDKGYQFAAIPSDMKPVQFRLASTSKWKKAGISLDTAEELLRKSVAAWPNVAGERASTITALHIQRGNTTWQLKPGEFRYLEDQYYVQLRALTDQMGGKVGWDAKTQIASVEVGTIRAEIDLKQHMATVYLPRDEKLHIPMDIHMDSNTTQVNLRDLMSVLQYHVMSYTEEDQNRVIRVE